MERTQAICSFYIQTKNECFLQETNEGILHVGGNSYHQNNNSVFVEADWSSCLEASAVVTEGLTPAGPCWKGRSSQTDGQTNSAALELLRGQQKKPEVKC